MRVVFAESIVDELKDALKRLDFQRIVVAAYTVIEDGEVASPEMTFSDVHGLDDVPCRQMWLRQGEHEQNIGLLTVYTMVFGDDLVILYAKAGHLIGIKERNRIREVYRAELSRRST